MMTLVSLNPDLFSWFPLLATYLGTLIPIHLDSNLHGSGYRTLKTSHVNLVLTLFIPRPVVTVTVKGQ